MKKRRYPKRLWEKQAQNGAETVQRVAELIALEKLADSGNVFAKHELASIRSGLPVNVKALLPKEPCRHVKKVGTLEFESGSWVSAQNGDGFEIYELICNQCAKTLEICVRKGGES